MYRKKAKKIKLTTTAVSLCSVMTLGATFPTQAADQERMKDENVYVTLKEDGSVSDVYVVNEYTSKSAGTVTDYGDYSSVKNLTTDSEIKLNGNMVTAEVEKGKFYYQGNLKDTDIPWNIEIAYYLDGKKIQAEDLAGKSGHLIMQIHIGENKKCDSTFFDNYLLQATVVLNTENCTNIQADGATAGNVGKDRQLLYNIMAGQEKDIKISADVEDFEMDGLTFQGVPMGFDIDTDSLDLSELTDKTDEIKDAVRSLDDGAGELKSGAKSAADGGESLKSGSAQLTGGVGSFLTGSKELKSGSTELLSGSLALSQGIETYTDGVAQLSEGSSSLSDGLKQLKTQVDALAASSQAMDLQKMLAQLSALQINLETLAEQSESLSQLLGADAQAANAIVMEQQMVMQSLGEQTGVANTQIANANQSLQINAATVNTQIDQAEAAIDQAVQTGAIDESAAGSLKANLEASRVEISLVGGATEIQMPEADMAMQQQAALLSQSAEKLSEASKGFSQAAEQMDVAAGQIRVPEDVKGMIAQLQSAVNSAYEGAAALDDGARKLDQSSDALKSGLAKLVWGSSRLDTGIGSAADGIFTLKNGADSLESGANELNEGLASLYDGTVELKDGTAEFKEQTEDIDAQIDEALDEMTEKISGTDYEPVSFASSENTDIGLVQFAIRTDDIKKIEVEEVKKTKKEETLWEKIKGLF